MHLPILKRENRYNQSLFGFGGINLTNNYSPGEMVSCSGISHMDFPSITQRQKCERVFDCVSPTAALVSKKECIAADDGLYYDREKIADLTPGKKIIAALGNKIIVFPDKLYYDTESGVAGDLCGKSESCGATVCQE